MNLGIQVLPLVDDGAYCLSCGQRFYPRRGGRKRLYCKDACKQEAFRNRKLLRNTTPEQRAALVSQQMAVGDWRILRTWPTWPGYTCLACDSAIGGSTPAWYDRHDWDQVSGIHRRHICTQCCPIQEASDVNH